MSSAKLIVRIKGGLGNQLFCYAAARRLALANEAEQVIDDVTGFARDRAYRRQYMLDRFRISARKATPHERMEPFERYRRGLAKYLARRRPFHRRRYVEQDGIEFDERLLTYKVRGAVYLDGLWQSEGYFQDVAPVIRQDLQIIPPQDRRNREMAQRIAACNAVAVHVRWFDPPGNEGSSHNASAEYYRRALDLIRGRIDKPHFFVFSDDPSSARTLLGLPEDTATCGDHNRDDENAYADLWLMSQCEHFIIANSTFSWWGAWLSPHGQKVVVAPGIVQSGISSWGFKGLIPPQWIQL
jgi:hypothetical protein